MKRFRWLLVWAAQAAVMLGAGCLCSLSLMAGGVFYWSCMCVILPLAGFATACGATMLGLLNYAAWIAPPLCEVLGHYLVWYYPPDAGPILLSAFVSLVGAATGEVLRRERKSDK